MATNNSRNDRFLWKSGDVTFDKGFKTKAQLIKEGKLTPDGKVVKNNGNSTSRKKPGK